MVVPAVPMQTRSVAIGRYELAVGAPAGSRIFQRAEESREAAKEVAEALREQTPGEVFEGAVADAQEATQRVEQAEALLKDVLDGRPWDPDDLTERAGEMLKVLARLDKDGRYEEWFRYARAINGLLELAMRWAKLVDSLRDVLRAAEHVKELERAFAWVEHELGTLHLAVEDAAGAERHLERAREIRARLKDREGLAATEQSLAVLCRQQATAGPRPDRRLLAVAALLLLLIGGVAGAILYPDEDAHALTVRVDGPGTVTSAPDGIRCPDTCDARFAADERVVLTAAAQPGATFVGWSGDCAGTRRCRLRADGAHSVTAHFERTVAAQTVAVTLAGGGSGEVTSAAGIDCPGSCRTSVRRGERVRLVATPLGDSEFAGWAGGGCSGVEDCVVTATGPDEVTVTATFDLEQPVEFTLTTSDGITVTTGSDDVGDDCTAGCRYQAGVEVTLTAAPPAGTTSGWTGCTPLDGQPDTCIVTMTMDRTVSVRFQQEPTPEAVP